MAGLQILRFEGRADLNVRLVDHVMARSRPKTAIDRSNQGIINIPIVDDYELAEGTITLGQLAANGRRGRQASHLLVDGVMGGPPPYEQRVDDNGDVIPGQPEPWSQEKIRRWALRSTAWIRRIVEANGLAKLCFVALHQDETSAHLHFAVVPRCSDGRLSWTKLKKEIAGVSTHRDDHSKRTAAKAMTALQDDYHKRVAQHFGLARGEPQSKTRRVHTAIDRVEAANRQAEIIRARAAAQTRQMVADAQAEAERIAQDAQDKGVIEALARDGAFETRREQFEAECERLASEKRSAEENLESLQRRRTEANQRLAETELDMRRKLEAGEQAAEQAAEGVASVKDRTKELAKTEQRIEKIVSDVKSHQEYLATIQQQVEEQINVRGTALEQANAERRRVADLEKKTSKLSEEMAAQELRHSKLTENTEKLQNRHDGLKTETTRLEEAYPGWLRKAPHIVDLGKREAFDEAVRQAETSSFWRGVTWVGALLRAVVHRLQFTPPVIVELVEMTAVSHDTEGNPLSSEARRKQLEDRERKFHEAVDAQETARPREPDSPPTQERPARKSGFGIGE